MPSKDANLQLAERTNETIKYLCLQKEIHSEWIATACFYRALHLAEAYLVVNGAVYDRTHVGREAVLKRTQQTKHIWQHYRVLWQASLIARYLAFNDVSYTSFSDYLTPDKVVSELVNHHLRQVENSVFRLLNIQ